MIDPVFTIAIPTYNRKDLLKRNLLNLELLNFECEEFEVIVVDDGSTDGTDVFISEFINETKLRIKYIQKENGGKFTAFNRAIEEAKGYFFINCDSDDYLHPDCLQNITSLWNNVDPEERKTVAGIIGNNYNLSTSKICGSPFPSANKLSDPIEMRFVHKVSGDKFPCLITEILRRFKFPDVSSRTKFIPESYLYYGISSQFKFIYTNIVFKYVEYQLGGLSSNIQKYRIVNAYGCYLAYAKYIQLIPPKKTVIGYARNYINYVRFSFHCKERRHLSSTLDLLLFAVGLSLYIKDIIVFGSTKASIPVQKK